MFVTLVDETGVVLWVSDAAPGLTSGDVVGKSVWHFAAPDVARQIRDSLLRALDGESVRQTIGIRLAGKLRHFESYWRLALLPNRKTIVITSREIDPRARLLSRRQSEILCSLVTCRSNLESSRALGLSERTVESHLRNIRRMLGIQTRQGLIAYAAHHFAEL